MRRNLAVGSALVIGIALAAFSQIAYGSTPANITFAESPVIKDLDGSTLTRVKIGQQVSLHILAHNAEGRGRPFVLVMMVLDANGIPVYATFQGSYVGPRQDYEMSSSWIPAEAGEHSIRAWALASLTEPRALSSIASSEIVVVEKGAS